MRSLVAPIERMKLPILQRTQGLRFVKGKQAGSSLLNVTWIVIVHRCRSLLGYHSPNSGIRHHIKGMLLNRIRFGSKYGNFSKRRMDACKVSFLGAGVSISDYHRLKLRAMSVNKPNT